MSIRRRRLSHCVRTVIDEMLHSLAREGRIGRASPMPPQAQTLRLEERLLMSATPAVALVECNGACESFTNVLSEGCVPAEFEGVNDEPGFRDPLCAENSELSIAGTEFVQPNFDIPIVDDAAKEQARVELIVIDSRVQDSDELLSVLLQSDRSYRLLRLEADQDGIRQITERLEELQSVSSIHLISHGRSGEVQIGSTPLNQDTLPDYQDQLRRWQSFLQPDADLLIYGCDVANSHQGQRLLSDLARLTGADVGGSNDATGHEQLGGDWDLEFFDGTLFTDTVFANQSAAGWTHILQSETLMVDTPDNIVSATATATATPQLIASNEMLVNTPSNVVQTTAVSGRGSPQAVATDAFGNSIIVWSERTTDGSGWGVYARRFFADGLANGAAFLVNSNTVNDQQWASVAMNAAGDFVVAWTASEQDGDGDGVYLKRYGANGASIDSFDVLANTGQVSGDQFNPVIALNDGGQAVVAWQHDTSSTTGIYARTFSLSDAVSSQSLNSPLITVSSGTNHSNPSVDMNNDGKFVIAWQQGNKALVQRFDSSGNARGLAIDLNPLNLLGVLGEDARPVVSIQSTGDFFVVMESDTVGAAGLWGRRYSDLGLGYGLSSFQIAVGADNQAPSISIGRDDSMAVVYEANDANNMGVYLQRYSASGDSLGTEIAVNQTTSGNQRNASVATLTEKASIVVWSGKGTQPGNSDNDGVFVRNVLTAPPAISTPADVSIQEDATLSNVILTIADSDTLISELTITAFSDNPSLISDSGIVLSGTGSTRRLSLTPIANQHGTAEITLAVSDGTSTTTTSFQLTVTAVDDRPEAVDDTYVTDEDTALVIDPSDGLLSNDTEPDDQDLLILDVRPPAVGVLELKQDGRFTYLPDAEFHGITSFQYLVDDGASDRTGYWNLDGTAMGSIGTSYGTVDGAVATQGVWGKALQFDGANDSVRITDPTYATAFTLSFWFRIPDLTGTGFQYLYSHGDLGDHDSLNIYLIESSTVGTNANNVLRTKFSNGTSSDSVGGLDINAAGLGLNDNQWHQYTLTVDSVSGLRIFIDGVQHAQKINGSEVINPNGDAWLGSRYDRNQARFFSGAMDTLQMFGRNLSSAEVADLYHGEPSVGDVQITVTSVNDVPILQTNSVGIVVEGSEIRIDDNLLRVSDADHSAADITFTLTSSPEHGWLQRDGLSMSPGETFTQEDLNNDRIRFLHDGSESVFDSFVFTVNDGAGGFISQQTFLLNVTQVNDQPPTIVSHSGASVVEIHVPEKSVLVTTLAATDTDLPAEVLTYSLAGGTDASKFAIDASTGVLTFAAEPDFEIPGDSDFDNVYEVIVSVSDGLFDTSQRFLVGVLDLYERPVLETNTGLTVDEGTSRAFSSQILRSVDIDSSAELIRYTLEARPSNGRILLEGNTLATGDSWTQQDIDNGRVTYFHDGSETTTDSFRFSLSDESGETVLVDDLTVDILAVNDAPTVRPWQGATYAGLALNVSAPGLLNGATDAEGDVVTVRLVQAPANGTVRVRANGSFTYTPTGGFVGVDSWLFVTTDGQNSSTPAMATVMVNPIQTPTSTGNSGAGATTPASNDSPPNGNGDAMGQPASPSGGGSGSAAAATDNGSGLLAPAGTEGPSSGDGTSPSDRRNSTAEISMNAVDRSDVTDEVRGLFSGIRESDQSRDAGVNRAKETGFETSRRHAAGSIEALAGISAGHRLDSWLSGAVAVREEVYHQLADQNRQTTEQFEKALNGDTAFRHRIVGSVGVVTTGFSVGYLMWAIRGGMLLSGLLAQMPAWTMLDPLLVVDDEPNNEDKESLQNIIDRQQRQIRRTTKSLSLETDKSISEKG